MGTRTTKEKKDKKVLIAILLLFISFAIVIGLAVSYFSDWTAQSVNATAGTLDIEAKAGTTKAIRYYAVGGVEQTPEEITNLVTGFSNLNPGDVVKLTFDIQNLGNKSAYLRNIVKFTSQTTNYTPATTDDPTLAEIGGVFTVYPVSGNTPTGIRAGSGTGAIALTAGSGSDSGKLVATPTSATILSGKTGSVGSEADGTSDQATVEYYLYFNKTAVNKFQGLSGIEFSVVAQAMQYRNNDASPVWTTIEQVTLNP